MKKLSIKKIIKVDIYLYIMVQFYLNQTFYTRRKIYINIILHVHVHA